MSAPHVQAEIRRINGELARGARGTMSTQAGLGDLVVAGLCAAGWVVVNPREAFGLVLFDLSEPKAIDADLERAGAAIVPKPPRQQT